MSLFCRWDRALSVRVSGAAPSGWLSLYPTYTALLSCCEAFRLLPQRSAQEFLRPKEISNWVMDIVTWTMRRQGLRNTIWVHYMCPLLTTDLAVTVPKQSCLSMKVALWGVCVGLIRWQWQNILLPESPDVFVWEKVAVVASDPQGAALTDSISRLLKHILGDLWSYLLHFTNIP